jgi:hypothetical protein
MSMRKLTLSRRPSLKQAEQALLKSRGLPPHRPPLALALDHLSVRGEGGSGVSFAPTVGSTFAPWTGAKDKRRMRKLEQAKGLDEVEKGEGEKQEKKLGEENLKKGEKCDLTLLHSFGQISTLTLDWLCYCQVPPARHLVRSSAVRNAARRRPTRLGLHDPPQGGRRPS